MQSRMLKLDRAGIVREAGEVGASLFGVRPSTMIGRNIMSFVPPAMHESVYQVWNLIVNGTRKSCILVSDHPEGHLVPIELRLTAREGSAEEPILLCKVRDRSVAAGLTEELQVARESYELLAETTNDAIVQIDQEMKIVFANSATGRIFGRETRDLLGEELSVLFPQSQYRRYRETIEKYFVIDEGEREQRGLTNVIEALGNRADGEVIPVEISFGSSRGVGAHRILTCILRDISLRKKADRRLRFLAYHDKLTSLGNRDRFSETLRRVLSEIEADENRRAALLYLDLDGFKKINDSLGHEAGDSILKACAKRLVNSLRRDDQVYRFDFDEIFRLGGDEFTIVLPYIRNVDDAAIVARRVIDRITEPFVVDGFQAVREVRLGVSIGIAVIPDDGTDPNVLLRNADAAMYRAKEQGNRFVFFTDDMNSMAVQRLMLEQGVRTALPKNEFQLYYQPIVDSNGDIVSVEALARWHHEERGVVSPDVFLPVIDDVGLTAPFGAWVLSTACRDLARLREKGHAGLRVSVNLSPKQLDDPELPDLIHKTLVRTGIDGSALILELTETALMGNPERTSRKLEAVKRLCPGVTVAVDDFGTGYSSLAYLINYPVDKLKIDRSFVMQMHEGDNRRIVQTIIDLARVLDLKIVAEGVESSDQLEVLKGQRCDWFQGYLFNRPAPFDDIVNSLLAPTGIPGPSEEGSIPGSNGKES